MTTYVTEDSVTGASILETTTNSLPLYEVGQMVVYNKSNSNTEVEATILGITQHTFITVEDEIVNQISYELDNGDEVFEDDVTKYY